MEKIWDGNGTNPYAALTVFRHFDSATVEKGLIGEPTKTAWLIDYSLLERIHYLLVAGYDVFGNVGHQLNTRLYMDFLRMEGESNFLLLLPEQTRLKERAYWYRDAKPEIIEYVSSPTMEKGIEPNIDYRTDNPKLELYAMLRGRLRPVLPQNHKLAAIDDDNIRKQLERLQQIVGTSATLMPEVTNVKIRSDDGDQYVTLLKNSAHSNMTALFSGDKYRLPAEDTLTVIPGFIGAYPNAFYVMDDSALADFVDTVSNLATEADYAALLDNWGIRRTDKRFWPHSDAVHTAYRADNPITFGRLDYNRLENR